MLRKSTRCAKLALLAMVLFYLGMVPFTATALTCTQVAEIYMSDKIDHVGILRTGQKLPEWASRKNRALCAGDIVIVPKAIPQLKIAYYSEGAKEEILTAGQKYPVKALKAPCSAWCRFTEKVERLYQKLTQKAPVTVTVTSVFDRSKKTDKPLRLSMPLAAGEGFDYPFYLFLHDGAIPLFWAGGKPPYQVEVTDAARERIVQETVKKTNTFVLTVENPTPNQPYTLTISSAEIEPYRKKLIFTVPPFPLDPKAEKFQVLATLLADPSKNWRLEIWRQLATMPDTEVRKNFKTHLILRDF